MSTVWTLWGTGCSGYVSILRVLFVTFEKSSYILSDVYKILVLIFKFQNFLNVRELPNIKKVKVSLCMNQKSMWQNYTSSFAVVFVFFENHWHGLCIVKKSNQ